MRPQYLANKKMVFFSIMTFYFLPHRPTLFFPRPHCRLISCRQTAIVLLRRYFRFAQSAASSGTVPGGSQWHITASSASLSFNQRTIFGANIF
jgi:hypothetical protein